MKGNLDLFLTRPIEELHEDEARGYIIRAACHIENGLNILLEARLKPVDYKAFELISNSSILPIAAKIKALQGLGELTNKDAQKLREFSNIRNSFAHARIPWNYKGSRSDDDNLTEIWSINLEVMNSAGTIKLKPAEEVYLEGMKIYKDFMSKFRDLFQKETLRKMKAKKEEDEK